MGSAPGSKGVARLLGAVGCLAVLAGGPAVAGSETRERLFRPDSTEVSLLAHPSGDTVRSAWGHVALRVRDVRSGADLVFDWGTSDAGEGAWSVLAFILGAPTYRLSIQAYPEMLRDHGAAGRTIEESPLRLSREETARLLARLAWNAREEHRAYRYAVFDDNCATRIRDLLDHALGGRLAARLTALPGGRTRREHVHSALAGRPVLGRSIDLLLGAEADVPLTAWQELFLPERLRAHLGDWPASAGAAVPGTPLLGSPRIVLTASAGSRPGRSTWPRTLSALVSPTMAGRVLGLAVPGVRASSRWAGPPWAIGLDEGGRSGLVLD